MTEKGAPFPHLIAIIFCTAENSLANEKTSGLQSIDLIFRFNHTGYSASLRGKEGSSTSICKGRKMEQRENALQL